MSLNFSGGSTAKSHQYSNYFSDIDNKIKNLRWILQEKNQTSYQETLNELQKSRRIALKILDKGGITVVLDGEDLITTYNINSFKRC